MTLTFKLVKMNKNDTCLSVHTLLSLPQGFPRHFCRITRLNAARPVVGVISAPRHTAVWAIYQCFNDTALFFQFTVKHTHQADCSKVVGKIWNQRLTVRMEKSTQTYNEQAHHSTTLTHMRLHMKLGPCIIQCLPCKKMRVQNMHYAYIWS